jgi:hypothetical protein
MRIGPSIRSWSSSTWGRPFSNNDMRNDKLIYLQSIGYHEMSSWAAMRRLVSRPKAKGVVRRALKSSLTRRKKQGSHPRIIGRSRQDSAAVLLLVAQYQMANANYENETELPLLDSQ